MARKGSNEFAARVRQPSDQTTGLPPDPTRVDDVYAGLEERHGEELLFHRIVTDTFHIGRDEDCNLVLKADTRVSRRHSTITREGVFFVLRDAGSRNGTHVNGRRISGSHELKVGDKIRIGRREFTFTMRLQG